MRNRNHARRAAHYTDRAVRATAVFDKQLETIARQVSAGLIPADLVEVWLASLPRAQQQQARARLAEDTS